MILTLLNTANGMTNFEHISDYDLTKDIAYLALISELMAVPCEYFEDW